MPATAKPRLRDLPDVDGPSFAAGEVPVWDGAKFVGESRATDAALAAHEADTTAVHGIANTSALVLTSDARLSDARTPTGTAGGVLSGTFPNPGFAADMATQAELDAAAASAVALAPTTSARNTVQPTAATVVPLIVKGAASQSANLEEWQSSTGAVLGAVGSSGAQQFKTDVWHTDTAAAERLHFAGAGRSYYKAPPTGASIAHTWRNGSDGEVMHLTGAGTLSVTQDISAAGNVSLVNSSGTGSSPPPFRLDGFSDALHFVAESSAAGPTATAIVLSTAGSAAPATEKLRLDGAGQLRLPITGAAAGLLLGGDAAIYRSAAGVLTADRLGWKAANEQTTVGATGTAAALPTLPRRYLRVVGSDGVELAIPAYTQA